jgi:hypothetical protein
MKKHIIIYLFILAITCILVSCEKNKTNNETAINENNITDNNIINTDNNIPELKEKTFKDVLSEYSISIDDSSVSDLNSAGFDLYEQGKDEDALILFRHSIEIDDTFAYGHYNIACMMSLLYGEGENINLSDLYYYLERSIELDSTRLEKARADSDFNSVRCRERFQDIVSPEKVKYYVVTDNAFELEMEDRLEEAFVLVNTDKGTDNKDECELVKTALTGLFSGREITEYNNYLDPSDLTVNDVYMSGDSMVIDLSGSLMGIGMAVDLYIMMQIEMTIEHYTDNQYTVFNHGTEIDWGLFFGGPSSDNLKKIY